MLDEVRHSATLPGAPTDSGRLSGAIGANGRPSDEGLVGREPLSRLSHAMLRMLNLLPRQPCPVLGIVTIVMVTAGCSTPPPKDPPRPPALWGDLKPVVSVKELMRDMIDPVADNIFDAVGTITTYKGSVEIAPKTDADWDKIRVGAVSLAEGSYLLKIPRPFAPPGDENNSSGPDAAELSPAEIKAKLEADPVLWNAKIEALRNVGLEVLEIVKKRDVDALLDAGGDLDVACETCHLEYWYPGEKTLMPKLDRRLQELYGTQVGRPLASHLRTTLPSTISSRQRVRTAGRQPARAVTPDFSALEPSLIGAR